MCIIPSKAWFYYFVPFVKFQTWKLVAHVINEWHRKCKAWPIHDRAQLWGEYRACTPCGVPNGQMHRKIIAAGKGWCHCELILHGGEQGRIPRWPQRQDLMAGRQWNHSPKSRMQREPSPFYAPCFCSVGQICIDWFRWVPSSCGFCLGLNGQAWMAEMDGRERDEAICSQATSIPASRQTTAGYSSW